MVSRRNSSPRLLRKQKKQLVRQTILSIIIGSVLLLGFIFFILPNTVKLLGVVLDTSVIEEQDNIPPQVPILSQPESFTNKSLFSIKGFAEPESEVITVLNGTALKAVTTNQDGVFEIELPLTEGENSFLLYSRDKAGNESHNSDSFTLVLDTQPPSLSLNDLADGQEFIGKSNREITIKGVTEPNARVYINKRLVLARSDGSFSIQFRLEEGKNTLDFRVIDRAGNQSEMSYSVNFKL